MNPSIFDNFKHILDRKLAYSQVDPVVLRKKKKNSKKRRRMANESRRINRKR